MADDSRFIVTEQPFDFDYEDTDVRESSVWDESKHHRDKGRFAHSQGAVGLKEKPKYAVTVGPGLGDPEKVLRRFFGTYYRRGESLVGTMPELVGAPEGSEAYVITDTSPLDGFGESVVVTIRHPSLAACVRKIYMDDDGNVCCHNDLLEVADKSTRGLGTKIFADQVAACTAAGLKQIDCFAADHTMNGYYTWPRLGYDCDLAKLSEESTTTMGTRLDKIREAYPKANTVQDIMDSEGGSEDWKRAKIDIPSAVFDLTPGSRSQKKLAAYVRHKKELSNA